jgi:hypothetical protein
MKLQGCGGGSSSMIQFAFVDYTTLLIAKGSLEWCLSPGVELPSPDSIVCHIDHYPILSTTNFGPRK